MLDSVLELITQAASSSTFIFCFCNLIIVIILLDLKPSISVHQESEIPLSLCANQKQGTSSKCLVEKDTGSLLQVAEVSSHGQEAGAEAEAEAEEDNIETDGNDGCSNEEEEKEEGEEDDELRRRVEEFIEKVNKGWKQELLSTSSLVYDPKSNEILA